MYRNIAIVQSVMVAMRPLNPDAILLVIANPVDLLTTLCQRLSGLPISQVFGSGTFLDSVRLRGLLAEKAQVSAFQFRAWSIQNTANQIQVAVSSIDLYVLGVQGESQVVPWSMATVGGIPVDTALSLTAVNHSELADECKYRSQGIIRAKGSTPFGISSIVSSICSSILLDKRDVRPVSHFQPDFNCYFSMPVVLGRNGIIRTVQIPLKDRERARISESAETLAATVERVMADMQCGQ